MTRTSQDSPRPIFSMESIESGLALFAQEVNQDLLEFKRLANKHPEFLSMVRDPASWDHLNGLDRSENSPYKDPVSKKRVVYFVQAGQNGPIKVGVALDITRRLRSLQNGNAKKLRLIGTIPGSYEHEKKIHQELGNHRLEGEWFEPHSDVRSYIRTLLAA